MVNSNENLAGAAGINSNTDVISASTNTPSSSKSKKSRPKTKKNNKNTDKKDGKRPIFSSPLLNAHAKESSTTVDEKHDEEQNAAKRARTVRAKDAEEENEERRLTDLLFGGGGGTVDHGTVDHGTVEQPDPTKHEPTSTSIDTADLHGTPLFEIDRTATSAPPPIDSDSDSDSPHNPAPTHHSDSSSCPSDSSSDSPPPSAWIDDDDRQLTVSLKSSDRIKKLRTSTTEDVVDGGDYERRLRDRFVQTASAAARTDWARVDGGESGGEEEEEDSNAVTELLSSNAPLLASAESSTPAQRRLPPNILGIERERDANQDAVGNCAVMAVRFHPGCGDEPGEDDDGPLLFTAGMDGTLRFFRVMEGGKRSVKIHGIKFPRLPIRSASWLGNSGTVVVSGRRKFFCFYDSVAGKIDTVPGIPGREEKSLENFTTSPDGTLIAFFGNDGYIILVEAKTKLWVANMKMNGSVRAITFTPDGRYIYSSGSDGDVYKWDVRTTLCVDKFQNQDGTVTTSISSSSRFLAVGAESGVVNLYPSSLTSSPSHRFQSERTPTKSFLNLRSPIDHTQFNHDGRILAMTTRKEKDGLRLMHVPSQTVFSNWPTSKTPLEYVWSLDFSPKSRFVAVGNDKGRCLLYKLKHYNT